MPKQLLDRLFSYQQQRELDSLDEVLKRIQKFFSNTPNYKPLPDYEEVE